MHHGIGLVRVKDAHHRIPVADIRMFKGVQVAGRDRCNIVQTRSIGQRIDVDHLVPLSDGLTHNS